MNSLSLPLVQKTPVTSTGQSRTIGSTAASSPKNTTGNDNDEVLNQMADPFAGSKKNSGGGQSADSSVDLADPFSDSHRGDPRSKRMSADSQLADPFAENSDYRRETSDGGIAKNETEDIVVDTIEAKFKGARDQLGEDLAVARSKLSPVNLAQYESEVKIATNFLDGLRHTITTIGYAHDFNKWMSDPQNGWGPLAQDLEKDGFSYVLKRIAPEWIVKTYEGPIGWLGSITLEGSSTQSASQDFDPMTVLNSPSQYSFAQREAALEKLYVSQGKHPEVWNESKCKWLYKITAQIYNSPDNPNIHLGPTNDPDIHLRPQ